jgi:hypothetical protein
VASSLFCFERDPHGLYSLPFQKAKVLRSREPADSPASFKRSGGELKTLIN